MFAVDSKVFTIIIIIATRKSKIDQLCFEKQIFHTKISLKQLFTKNNDKLVRLDP